MPADPKRVRDLFLGAAELPAADRAAYLSNHCGDDAELRAAVERLLAAHEGPARFVEHSPTADSEPPLDATIAATGRFIGDGHRPSEPGTAEFRQDDARASVEDTPPDHHVGRSVAGQIIAGRYSLREVLGEGGMGTVYLAEQTQPVKRQVALKLIKIGIDSRAVLARFDAERQALALMDHPNIARVYDGGTTEANQPFFVMELVKGEPITEYCDRRRLPVPARLKLFVAVCQAVQHAHQKGIIHRDLKPSNVMVTEVDGRPTPKVIDFGVAKATEVDLTDMSLGDTGAIVGTPTYMSPEQADPSSMDIDTRTDVYALGVILYELLAGSPPIDAKQFKRGAILEMLRLVREVEPPRPSTRVSTSDALANIAAGRDINPEHLKRALRGDLDWIVMKALEKDRARRYDTVIGFAADIKRHLSSEPVLAAPPSRAYRMRKFVRKHRGGVIAASLVLSALVAGIVGTSWGLFQAAQANASLAKKNVELDTANADLTRSRAAVQERYNLAVEAIKTFHTGVSEDFLLKEEKFKDLRDRLLRSAADFYGKLGALLGKETDIASRRALAQSNFELSDLTGTVGRKEDALAAHRAVLAAREELAAEPAAGVVAKVDIGRSLMAVAGLLDATGKTDEALATYLRAESLLAGPAGALPSARAALADCRSRLGWLLSRTGKTADALATYKLARADQEALAVAPEASNDARSDLALTIYRIGVLLAATGKPAEADAEYRRALELYQKLADDNPSVTKFRFDLARIHSSLGFLWDFGRSAKAEAEFRAALTLVQKLADGNPAVTEFRNHLASSHNNFGVLRRLTGKLAEAETELGITQALLQKLAEDNPAVTDFRFRLAHNHYHVGLVLSRMDKPVAAEAEYRKGLSMQQKLVDENPSVVGFRYELAYSHHMLGELLSNTGNATEAETEGHKALVIYQKLAEDDPAVAGFRSSLAQSHFYHGILLWNTGKPAEAEAEYRKALAIRQKLIDDYPSVIEFRRDLSRDYLRVAALQAWFGQDQALSSTCEKLLSLANDKTDPEIADKAAKCCSLRQTDPKLRENALVLARHAVKHGKDSRWLVYFEMALGMAEFRSGHFAEADAVLTATMDAALTAAMNDPGKNNTVSSTSAFYRAMALFRQGKTDLARKLATEATAKMKPLPVDEQKPVAGGADADDLTTADDLIMWMAYKEAKAMIQFDAAPAARRSATRNDRVSGTTQAPAKRSSSGVQSPRTITLRSDDNEAVSAKHEACPHLAVHVYPDRTLEVGVPWTEAIDRGPPMRRLAHDHAN